MREWIKRILYYFEPQSPRSEVYSVPSERPRPHIDPKVPATGHPTQPVRRSTTLSTPSVNRNSDDFSRVTHASAPDNTLANMMLGAIVYDAVSSDRGSDHSSYDSSSSSSSSSSYDSGSSSSDCGSSSSDGGGSCGGCD